MKKFYHLLLFAIQYCFYYFITPLAYLIYNNKNPWIVSERGDDARDNGYAFFRYLHDHQLSFINAYYLIKRKSVDYDKVKKLGNVIRYKSLRHWLLYRVAECRLSSHLSAFAPGNYIGEWFKHHKHKSIDVFLQHGINHNDYPSNYFKYNGCDLFVCGAKPEYDFLKDKGGYPKKGIVYTGLPRFDYLHNCTTKNQILLMPTWRNYLRGLPKKDFIESDYYKHYDSLLRNKNLQKYLEDNMITLVFYMHYSLQPYVDCFKGYGSNIIVADFDNYDVQQLLKESKLLITDYSSVFFDFAYMRKPLIYYQFDQKEFYKKHLSRGYFIHERDGFGEVVYDEEALIDALLTCNCSTIKEKYLNRINEFFPLYDENNSKRIFNAIINTLIDNKKYKTKMDKPVYLTFSGDDYGRNKESTLGIIEAYKKGYIQQASLMINRSKEDHKGIEILPKNKITYHFNITEGYQSYDDTSFYAYSVNQDSLAKRINNTRKSFFVIDKDDVIIIKKELKHQLIKYKQSGFNCTAFDSHGHIHNRLPIAKLIIPICNRYGFLVARIPSNIKHNHFLFDILYKKHVIHLYRKYFITTDYFCSCYDLIHTNLNRYGDKCIEIMTHPFMCNHKLENRRDIDFEILKKYINKFNVRLIDYNDLIKMKKTL